MKKWVQWILAVVFMIGSCPSALAYVETVKPQEGQTIADVETLAIGAPFYTAKEGVPTLEEYIQILNTSGEKILKGTIVTYDTVAQGIRQRTGKDVYTMDRHPAKRIFEQNVSDFADAYVVSTVTMSRRTVFFFDVYRAATNELLYSYEIIMESDDPNDVKTYTEMVGKFYKNFNWSAESQKKDQKEAAKAEQKEREKAERKAQREKEKAAGR